MTLAEYEELPADEKEHFFQCPKCSQFVDKRELRDVIFHVTDHKPKPEIPKNQGKGDSYTAFRTAGIGLESSGAFQLPPNRLTYQEPPHYTNDP